MREAPSVVLANLLLKAGAKVRPYDPVAMEEAKHDLGKPSPTVQTIWRLYKVQMPWRSLPNGRNSGADWEKVGQVMKTKVVFDGRNLYRREIVSEAGFDYYGIGMSENIAENINNA